MSDQISSDELAYLKAISEQEQATMTALRATRQSYESYLAGKYALAQGDKIEEGGRIVKASKAESPSDT